MISQLADLGTAFWIGALIGIVLGGGFFFNLFFGEKN